MTFRVLTAELSHDTNNFSHRVTNAQAFKDRYPLTGGEAIAARGIRATLGREIKPRTIRVSRPMLEETCGARTDSRPMIARLAAASDHEGRADVFAVIINAG